MTVSDFDKIDFHKSVGCCSISWDLHFSSHNVVKMAAVTAFLCIIVVVPVSRCSWALLPSNVVVGLQSCCVLS